MQILDQQKQILEKINKTAFENRQNNNNLSQQIKKKLGSIIIAAAKLKFDGGNLSNDISSGGKVLLNNNFNKTFQRHD